MAGLILEGVVGVGKTTLFGRLKSHPRFVARMATLALPEIYTERAFEHREERGLPDSMELLDRVLGPVEGFVGLHRESKFKDSADLGLAWLLDRLHFSHAMLFARGTFAHYGETEARLEVLGARVALLTVDEQQLGDRIARTRRGRPESWSWYLDHKVAGRTPGMSDAEVQDRLVMHYANEQRRLLQLARRSRLPVLELPTDDEAWDAYTEQLLDFWGL